MKALFPSAETTRGVTVRVSVSYLPEQSEPARGRWFWAYHIRIENEGDQPVQLLTRHWVITDGRGARHSVEGEGVVGEKPLIAPGGSYDYVSGCPLATPSGSMQGNYRMVGADGETFDAAIPKFDLLAPAVGGVKRTHLPLNGLRVLDAAARHLSFTRAADELAVTPAAVGQQVRALEDTLGVVLFRRTTRGLELTPEGEAGLGALREGFLQFEEAVRAMQAGQSSKSLTIAAPRDLTEKWLMPRLAEIARADGELRFALVAADETPDFTEANLDLAIRWGEGTGGHEGEAIESDGMVTVERPGGGVDTAIAWPGCPGDETPSIRVGDAGLAIDAAAEGLGRATVPQLLVARDIDGGRLAMVGDPRPSRLGYWLVAPLPQWRQKKVQALVAALAS